MKLLLILLVIFAVIIYLVYRAGKIKDKTDYEARFNQLKFIITLDNTPDRFEFIKNEFSELYQYRQKDSVKDSKLYVTFCLKYKDEWHEQLIEEGEY
jgi:uncharacterized protein YqgQ